MKHETKVPQNLIDTWVGKLDRLISEDSYFASVQSEISFDGMGLGFVSVFNQAPLQYTMAHLKRIFSPGVDCYILVLVDEVVTENMAFARGNRDRH